MRSNPYLDPICQGVLSRMCHREWIRCTQPKHVLPVLPSLPYTKSMQSVLPTLLVLHAHPGSDGQGTLCPKAILLAVLPVLPLLPRSYLVQAILPARLVLHSPSGAIDKHNLRVAHDVVAVAAHEQVGAQRLNEVRSQRQVVLPYVRRTRGSALTQGNLKFVA